MKKVFSVEKYIKYCKGNGDTEDDINYKVRKWAGKCQGLTVDEMWNQHRCLSSTDAWMVEVDDEVL